MIVNKDKIITFTQGEYSEYGIKYIAKVLGDFNLAAKKDEWLHRYTTRSLHRDCIGEYVNYNVNGITFVDWLASKGAIEILEYHEVHTNDRGVIKIDNEIGMYSNDD